MSGIPIHHPGTLWPARIQMINSARDKSPVLCQPIRAVANWPLELVKLCITADLFGAFIKAAAHPLTWPKIHNGAKPPLFLHSLILAIIFKLLCLSLLAIVKDYKGIINTKV